MYKRPPKHIQRAKLLALYSVMTIAVVAIVALLVMIVANYGYNKETGTFEQRGLVQFASTPSGATVEVDGTALSARTSTKSSVEPGEHTFTVRREGYEPWTLRTQIEEGSLVWLNYTRLVPTERPIETIRSYPALTSALTAPTNRTILAQLDSSRPSFRYIDITHDVPAGKTIELPESTYAPSEDEAATLKKATLRYSLGGWDDSGRFMLVWRILGTAKELIVLDTEQPGKTVNVSREFSLPIESAAFYGRSGNTLYVITGGNLRKLNISEGTITRSLVSDVARFSLQDTNIVTYVSQPDKETGARTVGVYTDGDQSPVVLKTIIDEKVPTAIASRVYYNTVYTVVTEGKNLWLYKGHHDRGIEGLELIASRALKSEITSAEFNATASHILLRAGTTFASYDIDRKLLSQADLEGGESKDLFWIDAMHLGMIHEGVLTMRDVDGTNIHELMTSLTGETAALSRNGTYIYSFGSSSDKAVSLQRIRMILK